MVAGLFFLRVEGIMIIVPVQQGAEPRGGNAKEGFRWILRAKSPKRAKPGKNVRDFHSWRFGLEQIWKC
jgi:hypothetical protein